MFRNREEAGRALARALERYSDEDVVVLALPRGGVPVAVPVAEELHAPVDVIVVRKLGVPFQPELAMGAVGEEGVLVLNEEIVRRSGVTPLELEALERAERHDVEARAARFRGDAPRTPLDGRVAVVVDDGMATGATALAACHVARALGASRVVVAGPIGSPDTVERLRQVADDVVCLETPMWFQAVGQGYVDFHQVPDSEVVALLSRARQQWLAKPHPKEPEDPASHDES
jgi:putative phosphoribosyl transferase